MDHVQISSYVMQPSSGRSNTPTTFADRRRAPSLSSVPIVNRRATTNKASQDVVNRRSGMLKPPQDWAGSSRPGLPKSETSTEQSLRDELKHMRASFDSFRKDCYSRLESVMNTNASLVENIGELKKQLNLTNTRLVESYSTRNAKRSVPHIDTDKLLEELSAKLLESPEFKDGVLAVIEEHEAQIVEEKKENEILLTSSPYHRQDESLTRRSISHFSPLKFTPISSSKRPTKIRDESYLVELDLGDDEDVVEILTDHGNDLLQYTNSPKYSERRDAPPKEEIYLNSELIEDSDGEDIINRTFTISDDEDCRQSSFIRRPSIGSYRPPTVNGSATRSKVFNAKESPIRQIMTRRRTTMLNR